jgi:hypothetical protein
MIAGRGHNRMRNRRRRPDRGDRIAVNHKRLQLAQKHHRRAMRERSDFPTFPRLCKNQLRMETRVVLL